MVFRRPANHDFVAVAVIRQLLTNKRSAAVFEVDVAFGDQSLQLGRTRTVKRGSALSLAIAPQKLDGEVVAG